MDQLAKSRWKTRINNKAAAVSNFKVRPTPARPVERYTYRRRKMACRSKLESRDNEVTPRRTSYLLRVGTSTGTHSH